MGQWDELLKREVKTQKGGPGSGRHPEGGSKEMDKNELKEAIKNQFKQGGMRIRSMGQLVNDFKDKAPESRIRLAVTELRQEGNLTLKP